MSILSPHSLAEFSFCPSKRPRKKEKFLTLVSSQSTQGLLPNFVLENGALADLSSHGIHTKLNTFNDQNLIQTEVFKDIFILGGPTCPKVKKPFGPPVLLVFFAKKVRKMH